MPTLAELNIAITSSSVREAKSALDEMTASATRTEAQITGLIKTAMELVGVYEAIRNVREAFDNALGEERIRAGLENLTGSAQTAYNMIAQLNQFSQNSQFALPGLEEDARLLTLMGIQADQTIPTLKALGSGLEAVGAPASSLNQVVLSLVRIREEGQLTRFTIQNLINAGVPAGEILSNAYGLSVPDIETASRNGAIDAANAVNVIIEKMNELGLKTTDTTHRFDLLFAELRNSAQGTMKDLFVGIIDAFGNSGGLSNAVALMQGFRAELDDVLNVLAGGKAHFSETNALIATMGALLRDIGAVLEIVIAMKLIGWVASLTSNLGGLISAMSILAGISLVEWADRNSKAVHGFFLNVKEAVDLLGTLLNTMGRMGGVMLADPTNKNGGGDQLDREYNKMWEDWNAIIDARNKIDNNGGMPKGSGPTTQPASGWGGIFSGSWDEVQHLITTYGAAPLDISKGLMGLGDPVALAKSMIAKAQAYGNQFGSLPGVSPEIGAPTQAIQKMQEQIDKVNAETQALNMNADARKAYLEQVKFQQELEKAGLDPTSGIGKQLMDSHDAALQHLEAMKQVDAVTKGFGDSAAKAFGEFITGAKNGRDALRDLGKAIEQLAVQQFVEKPIAENLNSLGNNLFSSLLGKTGSGIGSNIAYDPSTGGFNWAGSSGGGNVWGDSGVNWFSGFNASALGNAFMGGSLMPFANGGLVDGPTFFPMAGGMGLMGEAGPEAVMPLTRGPGGRLGVTAHGGAGTTINQTFNIRTNDADSFRRSERQIKQRFMGR